MSKRSEYRSRLFEIPQSDMVDRIEELESSLDRMLNPDVDNGEQFCNPVACEDAHIALNKRLSFGYEE